MSRHIGVVGITYPGALLCVQAICELANSIRGADRYPEMTIHCFPGEEYARRMAVNDWPGIADLMVRSAGKLADAGADFAIAPANAMHEVFDLVERRSPIPWISIVEATADEAIRLGYSTLGILGTRALKERRFYRDAFAARGLKTIIPDDATYAEMHRRIVEELVRNHFTDESRAFFRETAEELHKNGCEAVIMACTEIPLVLRQEDTGVPLLDSTRILAAAAVAEALR